MKILTFLGILISGSAFGFDPSGPPPDRTLAWTARVLAHGTIPIVDFKSVPLKDALATAGRIDVPEEYRLLVKVSDEEAVRDKVVTMKAKDISQLELLATIAEQCGLDLLIQPGIVVLCKRSKTTESGTPSKGQ